MTEPALQRWAELVAGVNGRTLFGQAGVRDPDNQCSEYDGLGYDGSGSCLSDGHYECQNCSKLAPNAPRFENEGGRADRLRLFWRRPGKVT